MPRYNQSTVLNGQYIDPTFGLNALQNESNEKVKAHMRQAAATNAMQKALAAKGLLGTAQVKVGENGIPEFQGTTDGLAGGELEKAYHNIGTQDMGIYGKQGKVVKDTPDFSNQQNAENTVRDFKTEALNKQLNIAGLQQDIGGNGFPSYSNMPPTPSNPIATAPSPSVITETNTSSQSPASAQVAPNAQTPIVNGSTSSTSHSSKFDTAAQKHTSMSVNSGSVGSSGTNYKTTEATDDGGNINDNLKMNGRDVLAAALDAQIQSIYGGNQEAAKPYNDILSQQNRINDQVNAANARVGSSKEVSALGQYNTTSDGGNRSIEVGQNQSSSIHQGDTTRNSGEKKENFRKYYGSDGHQMSVKFNPDTSEAEVPKGFSMLLTTNSLNESKDAKSVADLVTSNYKNEGALASSKNDANPNRFFAEPDPSNGNAVKIYKGGKLWGRHSLDEKEVLVKGDDGNYTKSVLKTALNGRDYVNKWKTTVYDLNEPESGKTFKGNIKVGMKDLQLNTNQVPQDR